MHEWSTTILLKHYLDQGLTKTELSRRFEVSRRTIHYWIESGRLDRDLATGHTRYSPRPAVASKLDPYKGIIEARLQEFPKLSAQRLFDEIRAAGYGRVRDYVRAVRSQEALDPVVRFETPAGRQGQVDFGKPVLPWGWRYAVGGGAERLAAAVRRAGADTVLNVMGYHSNNAGLAAAACVRAGFRYHVFLRHAAGMPVQGNSLVDHLLGAAVHLLNDEESERDMELARGVAERLRRAGAVPYVMNDELFPKLAGMIGFADAGLELADQLRAAVVSGPVRVVCVAGRSLCGLALASLNLDLGWRFTGVRVASAPAPAVLEAVRLAARSDGLMVDPNYTGVALAGLIDRIDDGAVGADETVVFVHTGGTPAIFSYAEELVPAAALAVTPAPAR